MWRQRLSRVRWLFLITSLIKPFASGSDDLCWYRLSQNCEGTLWVMSRTASVALAPLSCTPVIGQAKQPIHLCYPILCLCKKMVVLTLSSQTQVSSTNHCRMSTMKSSRHYGWEREGFLQQGNRMGSLDLGSHSAFLITSEL